MNHFPGLIIHRIILLQSCLLLGSCTLAQQFQLIEHADWSQPADSRSVNITDLNHDGWEDVYISNGKKGGQKDVVYFNDSSGNLILAPTMPASEAVNPSDGASFADLNNDGYTDGVISSWYGASDLIYLNNGKGLLYDHHSAGLVPGTFAETAAFGDFDQDGWVDLYISNSGRTKNNFLYKNLRDGTFERLTDHPLVQDEKLSRSVSWVDVNNDHQIDLFVTNEENAPNDLYINQGGGRFAKWTKGAIATDTSSSMTASWGDIDNDGDVDLFVGNAGYFSPQLNQLFRNDGDQFTQIKSDPVVEANTCTYSSAFGDYDNDGDLDLVIANGFCKTGLPNILYENQGDGSFKVRSGMLPANEAVCSFGLAWGDFNNDGFLDLIIANCQNGKTDTEKKNSYYRNAGNENNWLKVRLKGTHSNASAIGAKVKVKAMIDGKEVWQVREVRAQSGYAGQNSLVVHIGLKDAQIIEELIVHWPAGGKVVMERVGVNQLLELEEK